MTTDKEQKVMLIELMDNQMLMNEKKVDYKQGKQINVALTGMLEFSLAPPMRPSLWKFSGKTSLPNLRS